MNLALAFTLAGGPRDEFKAWFARSKVTNVDGSPRILYHGTAYEFDRFDPTERGKTTGAHGAEGAFFLAGNVSDAMLYRDKAVENEENRGREARGRILRAYARVTRPLILGYSRETSNVAQATLDRLINDDPAAIYYAKIHGKDGVIWPHGNVNNSGFTVAVFDADAIRIVGEV